MRRIRAFLGCALLLAVAGLCGCGAPGNTWSGAFTPAVGDTRHFDVEEEVTIALTVQGQSSSATVSSHEQLLVEVTDVAADGLVTLEVTFEGIDLTADLAIMDTFDFIDGEALDPEEYRDIVQGAVGETVTVKVDPAGEVRYTMGIRDLPDRLLHKAEFPYGPRRNTLVMLLKDQFSQFAFEEGLTAIFDGYRNVPTRPGESWQRTRDVVGDFPVKLDETITLTSLAGGKACLNDEMRITGQDALAEDLLPGLTATLNLAGSGTRDYRLDAATSWLEEFTETGRVPGTARIVVTGLGSLDININIISSTRVRVR